MKKAALAIIPFLVLFSAAVMSQLISSANANPNWIPWENTSPSTYPIINVVSPVDGGNYSSSDVWLNITVTKLDWLSTTNYQIKSISYAVYNMTTDTRYATKKLEVRDSLEVVDALFSFNFSVNIAGLKDGAHTLWYKVNGMGGDFEFELNALTIDFTVYTLKPEPFPTTLVATASGISVAAISLGLRVYFKKRKH
jgi:hypothetical protein